MADEIMGELVMVLRDISETLKDIESNQKKTLVLHERNLTCQEKQYQNRTSMESVLRDSFQVLKEGQIKQDEVQEKFNNVLDMFDDYSRPLSRNVSPLDLREGLKREKDSAGGIDHPDEDENDPY